MNDCNKFSDGIIMVLLVTGGGVDYDSGPYTVTFPAGVTRVPFDVPINDDNVLEDDESFTLGIDPSSLPDDVTRGNPGSATVTINNTVSKYGNYNN